MPLSESPSIEEEDLSDLSLAQSKMTQSSTLIYLIYEKEMSRLVPTQLTLVLCLNLSTPSTRSRQLTLSSERVDDELGQKYTLSLSWHSWSFPSK